MSADCSPTQPMNNKCIFVFIVIYLYISPVESGTKLPNDIPRSNHSMHIYFEVTNMCNLKCEYCYNDSGSVKHSELQLEQFFSIIDDMTDRLSLSSITFSGGEPLLKRDIFHMLNYCKYKGIKVYLITNGTLIDERVYHYLQLVDHITVSLHKDYQCNIDFNTLKKLRSNTALKFSVVLNKMNYTALDEYCKFATSMRIPISFNLQKAMGRGQNEKLLSGFEIELAESILQHYSKSPFVRTHRLIDTNFSSCCYFSCDFDEYTMLPNGDIYLCQILPRIYKVGNALEKSWKNNVATAKSELYRNWLKYKNRICGACYLSEVCRGICPGEIIDDEIKCLQCEARCKQYLYKSTGIQPVIFQ